jgi:hypothetical protein
MPNSPDPQEDREEAFSVSDWLDEVSARNSQAAQEPPALAPFPQLRKRFAIRCGLLFLAIIALRLDYYRHGINLQTNGAFSSTTILLLVVLILFCIAVASAVPMLCAPLRSFSQKLTIVLFFPAVLFSPRLLNVPGFVDGAARTLRQLDISDELVMGVSEEIKKPVDEINKWWLETERTQQILSQPAFSKLGLKYAKLGFRDNCLLFEFGSPIADRWGFAISSIRGKPPSIPPDRFNLRPVSREIVVFEGPID